MRRRFLLALAATAACAGPAGGVPREGRAGAVHRRFSAQVDSLALRLDALDSAVARLDGSAAAARRAQAAFAGARTAYKHAEPLLELYYPSTAQALNGAPLVRMEENDPNQRPAKPEGFQVIEEGLYPTPAPDAREATLNEVRIARTHVRRLAALVEGLRPDDANVLDAARLELARVATLGLAGFDSPVALRSLAEAADALDGVRLLLEPYRDRGAGVDVDRRLADAARVLRASPSFDRFDRLAFLVDHLDPAMRAVGAFRVAARVPLPADSRRLWAAQAASLFEPAAWDPGAVAPAGTPAGTAALAHLGERLLAEPALSDDGRTACTTCHVPALAFTDGRARSVARGGRRDVLRNAPTLLNVALQRRYFADLRVAHLEDQVADVVANPAEMHGSLDGAARRLAARADYRERLAAALGAGRAPTGDDLRRAIAAHLRTLVRLDSRWDRYVRGDRAALDAEEQLGFNLFMGKAKCGTCHFMPLFNGTVPPAYVESESEVLGVPARPDTAGATLDPDEGRARTTGLAVHRFAFKTPTVRNVDVTAPYMHNGAYATLDEVVDFYARGGGVGIGIELEHQTLPFDRLELAPRERAALVAFMRALTDTAGASVQRALARR